MEKSENQFKLALILCIKLTKKINGEPINAKKGFFGKRVNLFKRLKVN